MKKLLIASAAAVVVLAATGAQAADMAAKVYAKAPPIAAPYSWGGFYVGGNVGYNWSANRDPRLSFVDVSGGLTGFLAGGGIAPFSPNPKGVIGGGQIGYNWQSANIVYGVVADFQGSDVKGGATFVGTPPTAVTNLTSRIEWFGTVRGRVGLAQDNLLFYGTGGLAYGQIKENINFVINGFPTNGNGSSSETKAGWTVGAGVEYGIGRWSAGFEYLYVDLGRSSVTMPIVPAPIDFVTISSRNTSHVARALINYRF